MTELSQSTTFTITSAPRLVQGDLRDTAQKTGNIKSIPSSGDLGLGLGDRIYLIGHNDGLTLNTPYQVSNLQDAINVLGENIESPLLRGMFDAYNEGARDIWLVAAAPMSEYVDTIADRNTSYEALGNQTFYETYHARLATTYALLAEFSEVELVVPLEAPFYYTANVDFLTQLADHCTEGLATTGRVRIGFIGTRIATHVASEVETMTSDARLATVAASSGGKFVMIIGGEVSVSHPQVQVGYTSSGATLAAAALAATRIDRGIMHKRFRSAINLNHKEYTEAQNSALALAKINWLGKTRIGRRRVPFQVHALTDNTLSSQYSTFWAASHVRIMSKVINGLQSLGSQYIGTVSYPSFRQDVASYLNYLMSDNILKDYSLNIYRDEEDLNTVKVEVALTLFGTLREVFLSVAVGNKSMVT